MAAKTIFDPRYVKLVSELVKIRHNNGWSQRKLSEILSVPHNSVARIELRERRLDLVETIDYLKALKVPKAEIIKIIEKLL